MSVQAERGWVPTVETFGARLALVRQLMGWTNLKEAALACGLPVQSWRNWETRNRIPRDIVGIARQIADATGVDYYWLLDGSSGPGTPNGAPQDAVRTDVRPEGFEPPTF